MNRPDFTHPRFADNVVGQAPLAQLAEQLTLNQRVVGSSPTRCTSRKTHPTGWVFLLLAEPVGSMN